jgi:hypothetical protein
VGIVEGGRDLGLDTPGNEMLARVVGEGSYVELIIDDIRGELRTRPVTGALWFRHAPRLAGHGSAQDGGLLSKKKLLAGDLLPGLHELDLE